MARARVVVALGLASGAATGGAVAWATGEQAPPAVELRAVDSTSGATSGPGREPATPGVTGGAGDPGDAAKAPVTTPAPTTTTTASTPTTPGPAPDRGAGRGGGDGPTAAAARGWDLVAEEDFGGTSLDTGRWTVYDGPGNGGVGLRRPEAISVADGTVRITGRGDVSGGMNWNGGRTYGRWEMRARSDAGNGYAPNLLLWPSSGNWPDEGEINVMEIPDGARAESYFVVHWGPDNTQDSFVARGDFTRWHNFAVEWLPDRVTFYLDGRPMYTNTDPAAVPDDPMHLSIQNDVGPFRDWIPPRDATTPDEVSLEVDWVRIYAP